MPDHYERREAEHETARSWLRWIIYPGATFVTAVGLATFYYSDFPRAWLLPIVFHTVAIAVIWCLCGSLTCLLWVRGNLLREGKPGA